MKMNLHDKILKHVKNKYGVEPSHLWMKYPEYEVLRHLDTNKWFGIFLNKPGEDIVFGFRVNDVLLHDLLLQQDGYSVCYHMPKQSWLSVSLDGRISYKDVIKWIDLSFMSTASSQMILKFRSPKSWIIPSNPAIFDICREFRFVDELTWTSSKGMKAGDTVYVYVSAPVSAIMFKCEVIDTGLPFTVFDVDGKPRVIDIMKIRKVGEYSSLDFPLDDLRSKYDVRFIRGPRGVPRGLQEALESKFKSC